MLLGKYLFLLEPLFSRRLSHSTVFGQPLVFVKIKSVVALLGAVSFLKQKNEVHRYHRHQQAALNIGASHADRCLSCRVIRCYKLIVARVTGSSALTRAGKEKSAAVASTQNTA